MPPLRSKLLGFIRPKHPAQQVANAFFLATIVITLLLMLPAASNTEGSAPLHTAVFTATSALCVVGLATVDIGTYWTHFGQVIILLAVQVGGIGIMTLASLLGLIVSRRMGLRTRLTAAVESQSFGIGDVRRLLRDVAITMVVIELCLTVVLALRLYLHYDESLRFSLWSGLFHSVMAANNGGLSLYPDSFIQFVTDPYFCIPVIIVIILSSLGFPVLFELVREVRHPKTWSLHSKITALGTVILVFGGWFFFTLFEWSNPGTFGPLDAPGKILAGLFQSVTTRSAGFNTIDFGNADPATLLGADVLMFIGGGSGGTAGGIKVTTFMVLLFAILAEARGDSTIDVYGRRLAASSLRLAISVALLGIAVVVAGTMGMLLTQPGSLDEILFETISAFSTTGLSTGLTAELTPVAHYVLTVVMFIGRIGTITLASALALRTRRRLYRLPEEQPIVG